MAVLAQFPLQSVLLPGMGLGLQVFEPRYVALLNDVGRQGGQGQGAVEGTDGGRFGVVLITRGSEVGGDDQRADVGTVAQITDKRTVVDGVWLVEAHGTERFRVVDWHDDDPYPEAEVELWPATLGEQDRQSMASVTRDFERILLMANELGADVSGVGDIEFGMAGIYRMTEVIPITAYDRYRILAAATGSESLHQLGQALVGVTELLRYQLSGDDS